MPDFVYQEPFPLAKDQTTYRLLPDSQKYVTIIDFNDQKILKVAPEALTTLANQAMSPSCCVPPITSR